GIRSEGRGRGISGNIGIDGGSNVSRFASGFRYQDANYDNGSIIGGRGKGITRNIGIGGGSNVSEFRYQDADYDNGCRSGGREMGKSGNIGGRGSSTSRCGNPNTDYDNGSISRRRGI
ncbi:hypothetical protein Tco_0430373, partial [Tanacetum coccineum]